MFTISQHRKAQKGEGANLSGGAMLGEGQELGQMFVWVLTLEDL